MEQFHTLEDIVLIPSDFNKGIPESVSYLVNEKADLSVPKSLPIFTAPLAAIMDSDCCRFWQEMGIRPVIPRTESIESRLDLCRIVFASFTLAEIGEYFLKDKRRIDTNNQYHICIDTLNGHNTKIFDLGVKLKQMYHPGQILLMGGPISSIKAYEYYARSGFDFVRVGSHSDTIVDNAPNLFEFPMASLLDSIKQFKSRAGVGLPQVKIIADGEIDNYIEIMKAIALGADYVMIGQEFARVVEAAGMVYRYERNPNTGEISEKIEQDNLPNGYPGFKAKINSFCRDYYCNASFEKQLYKEGFKSIEEWRQKRKKIVSANWSKIDIDINLDEWIEEFKTYVRNGFMMTSSGSWEEYQKNVRYGVC